MGVWSWDHLLDKWIDNITPGKPKRIQKMPPLRMASRNFRTTRTELSDDLQSIDNARMTAVINMELERLNFEIACLQKKKKHVAERTKIHVLLAGEESRRKQWTCGRFCREEHATHNDWIPANGSERILAIRLSTQAGPVNLMSIYSPTLCSISESKYQFYEEFDATISRIPKTEQLYLTLMQEWVLIMRHGLPVSDTMAWGKWMKMDRDYSSCAAIMNFPSQTLSLKTNHVANCPGYIPGQVIRTNLTSFSHRCPQHTLLPQRGLWHWFSMTPSDTYSQSPTQGA